MYDKKNFFPHTHKKIPQKNRPHKQKKRKKRAENHTLKTASEGKRKKPNQK